MNPFSWGNYLKLHCMLWPCVSHSLWAPCPASPLSAWGAAGPPSEACQRTVSRQRAPWPPVVLDQWAHLHTHLSSGLSQRRTRRRTHLGWLMTWFWMKRWLWIDWITAMRLKLTNLREAFVWRDTSVKRAATPFVCLCTKMTSTHHILIIYSLYPNFIIPPKKDPLLFSFASCFPHATHRVLINCSQ